MTQDRAYKSGFSFLRICLKIEKDLESIVKDASEILEKSFKAKVEKVQSTNLNDLLKELEKKMKTTALIPEKVSTTGE